MADVKLLCFIVLAALHVHSASSREHRVLYKLQDICDPIVLQAATAAGATDLKVTPRNLWSFVSNSLESRGDGWYAPRTHVLPHVLRQYASGLLRMSYSVYSRIVVLEVSSQDMRDSMVQQLQDWTSAGHCLSGMSADHRLLRLQSSGSADAARGSEDPRLRDQWGLFAIDVMNDHSQHVPGAWGSTTGEAAITVAVVDTGIDFSHPDLAANKWTNTGETAGDKLDNDGNGFADDCNGYNFVQDSGDISDKNGHGSHMAGIIGAQGDNGVGVSGVAMEVRLMALKAFADEDGSARLSDVIRALEYAAFMAAHVVLLPAVAQSDDHTAFVLLEQAVASLDAEGILLVVPAGNEQLDLEQHPRYPASFSSASMIVVGASNGTETIATWSNYGKGQVDLLAPGVSIITTAPGGELVPVSGTSAAASFVAGVAALLLSDLVKHEQPYQGFGPWVKSVIVNSVDYHKEYEALVASGGRLNAGKALALQQHLLGVHEPTKQQDAGRADDGWMVGTDPQKSPLPLTIDQSLHTQQGWGPVMRIDVPVVRSTSSLRDSDRLLPLQDTQAQQQLQQQQQQQQTQQQPQTASSSRFSWLWSSITAADRGGLFHGCDDFRDCGAK